MEGKEARDPQAALSRWTMIASVAILVGLLASLADPAYEFIFSDLNLADDEGSVTITLRSFVQGEALYDDVYTQYGPGFYTIVGGAMELLGVGFDNDGARFVNLFFWLASTLLGGLVLLKLTRNLVIAAVGLAITFVILFTDAIEPLHPGAAIGCFLLLLVAAAVYLYPSRIPAAMAAIGGIAVILCSTKLNVGAFAVLSIALAVAITSAQVRARRALTVAICVGFVIAPLLLMYAKLDHPDTARYGAIVTLGALGLVAVASRFTPGPRPNRSDLAWLGAGALAVLAVVVAVPIVLGASPGGLVEGWLIQPTRHVDSIFAPLRIDGLAVAWGAFGLGCALCVALIKMDPTPPARAWLAAARIAVGLLVWLAMASPIFGLSFWLTQPLVVATPFAWVAAIPPAGSTRIGFVRMLIPALAVLQTLHAFPVAGSQVAWSDLLLVIVGGVCIGDGIRELSAIWPAARPSRALAAVATVAVAAFGAWFALDRLVPFTEDADARYEQAVPLELPGAERTRTNPDHAIQLRGLTDDLRLHCETFLTVPGLNSLYFYTGQPVPEELSSTWMLFLSDEEQQAVVDRVRELPGLCVVRQPQGLAFWSQFTDGQGIRRGPLIEFIHTEFRTVENHEGYYLEVRK